MHREPFMNGDVLDVAVVGEGLFAFGNLSEAEGGAMSGVWREGR